MATIQCFVADQRGKVLAEIEPAFGTIPWQLNAPCKTTITLSKSDSKANRTNLEIGNFVYLRFSNGLPDWAGTIELPHSWSGDSITVTCYTIDYLLGYRITGKSRNFYNSPVGTIFRTLLYEAQAVQSLNINIGSVWMGGSGHFPRYHIKSVLDILTGSLHNMEGCDYAFLPQLANGVVAFTGELYAIRGLDKSGKVSLIENVNVSRATLEKQGPIVNRFVSAGTGTTWGTERAIVIAEEQTSIRDYRLREASDVFSDVSLGTTLEGHSRTQVNENSFPHNVFELEASNTAPAEFGSYDVGDIIRLILPSYDFDGYDGSVRVLAREFDPSTDKCTLVVEEPTLPTLTMVAEETESE